MRKELQNNNPSTVWLHAQVRDPWVILVTPIKDLHCNQFDAIYVLYRLEYILLIGTAVLLHLVVCV